jgi:hypothetical protein
MDFLFILAGAALWGLTMLLGLALRRLEAPAQENKPGERA